MGSWTAQLRLEDGQCTANAMSTNVHGTAGFGEADQRDQDVVQTKRQQQTLAGTKDHRAEITGAVDNMAQRVDPHCEDRPHQRDNQTYQS